MIQTIDFFTCDVCGFEQWDRIIDPVDNSISYRCGHCDNIWSDADMEHQARSASEHYGHEHAKLISDHMLIGLRGTS